MRIAFVTCNAYADGREEDVAVAALVGAEFRVWSDASVDWHAYDRVILRSPWDYSQQVEAFLEWCEAVGGERLLNRPELIAFNADKRYLGALDVPTVPTTFLAPGTPLERYSREIVVKPNVSAGARDTGRFEPEAAEEAAALIAEIHASGRTALVQPYLAGVEQLGETAIAFLGGRCSHVLNKRPVLRDAGVAPLSELAHGPAAVMLEHDLVAASSANEAELALAQRVIAELSGRFGTPLYARVDMIPGADGAPLLLELEAIEPNLYLHLVPGSVERFADAIRACSLS